MRAIMMGVFLCIFETYLWSGNYNCEASSIFFKEISDGGIIDLPGHTWAEDDSQTQILNLENDHSWEIKPQGTYLGNRKLELSIAYYGPKANTPYSLRAYLSDSSGRAINDLHYNYETLPSSLKFEITDYSASNGYYLFEISCKEINETQQ